MKLMKLRWTSLIQKVTIWYRIACFNGYSLASAVSASPFVLWIVPSG